MWELLPQEQQIIAIISGSNFVTEVDEFLVIKSVSHQEPNTVASETLDKYVLNYFSTELNSCFLTPCRKVPLENLNEYQLVKTFPA